MAAVYSVVKLVPKGQVATYSQVATYVVSPRHGRAVGSALRHLPLQLTKEVPWHRVINAGGRISHRGDLERPRLQREKLLQEGVVIDSRERIDLLIFGWSGPPEDWCPSFPYPFPVKTKTERSHG